MKAEHGADLRLAVFTAAADTFPDTAVGRMLKTFVVAIFFASGAASLILQVVWFKQLQFVLGSSTLSVGVTVASFFFGLSVGSALGGRVADIVARPLRFTDFSSCFSPLRHLP
jgi:predicted MFS family arabinose efflux permease